MTDGTPVKIAIRADASTLIGTGHIRRCRSLATALRNRGAQVRFVCRNAGLDYATILAEQPILLPMAQGYLRTESDAPPHAQWLGVSQMQDGNDSIAALKQWEPDWVLVDHYAIDARWHKAVRAALGCGIAVIDDLADRMLDADLVIDQNWHTNHEAKYDGWLVRPSIMACGPQYAMIDQHYATAARYKFRNEVRSIGIFMGGTDAVNANAIALQAVIEAGFLGEVEIVTTSANPNLADLRGMAQARSRTQVTTDLPNLAAFFARHDLQIGAGGSATWERFCIGAPTIAVATANNQLDVLVALTQLGYQWGAYTLDVDLLNAIIEDALGNSRKRYQQVERTMQLIDGQGIDRVAEFFSS